MMLTVRKNTSSSIRMTHLVEGRIFMVLNRSIRDKIYLRQMRGIDGYLEHKVTIQKILEGSEEMESNRKKLEKADVFEQNETVQNSGDSKFLRADGYDLDQ